MAEQESATPTSPAAGSSKRPVRVGLLGCGTVGGGALTLLAEHAAKLAARVGAPIEVRKVLVRDLDKPRVEACDRSWLTTDPADLLDDDDIDIVLEVVGGAEVAKDFVERALDGKKGVVTANKMLLALHGPALLSRAVSAGVDLAFEGAVGGGIPVVRTLREAFVSDGVRSLTGILNGTSNYVLTRMLDDGSTFADAVASAQALGYAEADPSMDVGGGDAAHKLWILALLGFGAHVPLDDVSVEGIEAIEAVDHELAERFGYCIKHLVIGRDHGDTVELRVHPAMIDRRGVLANVSGVLNAVLIEGDGLGPCLVSGRGAGDLPTAVSVVSDLVDVARAHVAGVAGLSTRGIRFSERRLMPLGRVRTRYYVRFAVRDEPGVMAALAGALGDESVSIEQLVQARGSEGEPATVVMVTHEAEEAAVQRALAKLANTPFMARPPRLIRIEAP